MRDCPQLALNHVKRRKKTQITKEAPTRWKHELFFFTLSSLFVNQNGSVVEEHVSFSVLYFFFCLFVRIRREIMYKAT